MRSKFEKFFHEETAATAVEYAFLIALIALVLVKSANIVGVRSVGVFEATAEALPPK